MMGKMRMGARIAALMGLLALWAGEAQGQVQPFIRVEPASGPAGSTVRISGGNFAAGSCAVELQFDPPSGPLLTSAGLDGGAFSTTATIPANATIGKHAIRAEGRQFSGEFCTAPTGESADGGFEVTGPAPDAVDYHIYLAARILGPECSVDEQFLADIQTSGVPLTYALVQLHALPRQKTDDVEALESIGITLLSYLNGKDGLGTAYLAGIADTVDPDSPIFGELVRCVFPLTIDDKLQVGLVNILRKNRGTNTQRVLVKFFDDVSADDARRLFAALKLAPTEYDPPSTWLTQASTSDIIALASENLVQWVEDGPPPLLPTNDEERALLRVDEVQQLDTNTGVYAGLSGNGVDIAIMDTGVDTEHNDFAGRRTRAQDDGGDHGSHVAGIAGGSGAQSNQNDDAANPNGGTAFQWRGMAPRADLIAYGQGGGNSGNYKDGVDNFSMDVSNHSYVLEVQSLYDGDVASVDRIVRGDVSDLPPRPVVWAAGNNGSVGPRDCDGDTIPDGNWPQYPSGCPSAYQTGYFSILGPCKNTIVVANVTKGLVHNPSSSMGPTMDGRLKPDVSAIGSSVTSVGANTDRDGNAVTGNGYRSKNGTSMAAPAVTGVVALLLEQYAATFGANIDNNPPLPSTSKAVLIQTATDLLGPDGGTNPDTGAATQYGPGPDWATGYGLVNAEAAVRIIETQTFLEDVVNTDDPTDDWSVAVDDGQRVLRVTLAWDDIAGTPNADASAAQLINDLDLVLIDPNNNVYQPLVLPIPTPLDCDGNNGNGVQVGTCPGLDAAGQNYFGPAAPGVDRRNNVEQVVVRDAAGLTPGNWTARVSVLNSDGSTVRLPLGGDQSYSLVIGQPNRPPVAQCVGTVVELNADTNCCVTVDLADIDAGSFDSNGVGDVATLCISDVDGNTTGCVQSVEICDDGTLANHPVTLTIIDQLGLVDTCTAQVDVIDVTPPDITTCGSTGGEVDDNCEYVMPFSATVTDNCRINAADVTVAAAVTTNNAQVGTPVVQAVQVDANLVEVTGTVVVSALTGCPATVQITVNASDSSGNAAEPCITQADVIDTIPPTVFCPLPLFLGRGPGAICPMTPQEWLDSFTATDNCDANPTLSNNAIEQSAACCIFPCDGSTDVTFTAEDDCGNTNSCVSTITSDPNHPGWNASDVGLTLTANQPTYWSANSGDPATGGVSAFDILDPGCLRGRVDPECGGFRTMRGFIVAYAVNGTGQEIRWNHLKGDVTVVNYAEGLAWEYSAYAFRVAEASGIAHGAPTLTNGQLALNGTVYAAGPDLLLLDFYADGAGVFGGPVESELTLMPLDIDLRQESAGPVVTKASFTVWNMNETKFTGLDRCVSCWDQLLFANYGAPNHLLLANLQTDKGKAQIDGVASQRCNLDYDQGDQLPLGGDPRDVVSQAASIIGVSTKYLHFTPERQDAVASELAVMGNQSGLIQVDTSGGVPPERPTGMSAPDTDAVAVESPSGRTMPGAGVQTPVPAAGPALERLSASEKGSLLIFPVIEIRWDSEGTVLQDTFIDVTNDYPDDVSVHMYFVNGDRPLP